MSISAPAALESAVGAANVSREISEVGLVEDEFSLATEAAASSVPASDSPSSSHPVGNRASSVCNGV